MTNHSVLSSAALAKVCDQLADGMVASDEQDALRAAADRLRFHVSGPPPAPEPTPAPEIYGVTETSDTPGKVRVMLVDGTWHDEYVAVVRERLRLEGKTWTEGMRWTITARPTHCYVPAYANTKGEIHFGLGYHTHDAAAQNGAPRDGFLGVIRRPLDFVNGDDDA